MRTSVVLSVVILLGSPLAGCNSKDKPAPPRASTVVAPQVEVVKVDARVEAASLFKSTCTVCHGDSGAGDGPGAAAMKPKPRNFADKEWQAAITDDELTKVILGGGMAVGKSPLMPGNPSLKTKPEVVAELVKMIRSFAK